MPNYYEILGVATTATPDDIKKSYRKLAGQHHPDRAGGNTEKFQEIQAAYDVLGSPEKRQRYDLERSGMGNSGPGPFGFQDVGDFFRQVFQQNHQQHQPRRNRDLRIRIILRLEETLVETEKTISVKTTRNTRDTVVVKLPVGITANSIVKYPGLGDNFFESLPRGDLYVYIDIQPHANFAVQGHDLETEIRIGCFDAMLGTEKIVSALDGAKLSVKIPSGTQPGTVLMLKNQGLAIHNSQQRGNLKIKVQVQIPANLSEEQLETIKQLRQEIAS
jgi:DnaJ-class molecular chaperone